MRAVPIRFSVIIACLFLFTAVGCRSSISEQDVFGAYTPIGVSNLGTLVIESNMTYTCSMSSANGEWLSFSGEWQWGHSSSGRRRILLRDVAWDWRNETNAVSRRDYDLPIKRRDGKVCIVINSDRSQYFVKK